MSSAFSPDYKTDNPFTEPCGMSSGFAREFLQPESAKNVYAHVCVHLCVLKQSPVQTGITAKSLCQQSQFTLVILTENQVSNRLLGVRANTVVVVAALKEAPNFYTFHHVKPNSNYRLEVRCISVACSGKQRLRMLVELAATSSGSSINSFSRRARPF